MSLDGTTITYTTSTPVLQSLVSLCASAGFSRGRDDSLQPGMPIPGITQRVVLESRSDGILLFSPRKSSLRDRKFTHLDS